MLIIFPMKAAHDVMRSSSRSKLIRRLGYDFFRFMNG
jgi:hypothetical protein